MTVILNQYLILNTLTSESIFSELSSIDFLLYWQGESV